MDTLEKWFKDPEMKKLMKDNESVAFLERQEASLRKVRMTAFLQQAPVPGPCA